MPKNPKKKFEPQTEKSPRVASEPSDWFGRLPSWRISRLEFCTPWGWHEIEGELARAIQARLASFESMTWREILIDSNKQNHLVGVWQLCGEARKRLEELGYGDLKKIVSLRLTGRERIWGVMEEGTLAVLWWDPEHTVYPVEKRNT